MNPEFINVEIQLPLAVARICAQMCGIPESAIGTVEFSVFIQQILRYHAAQQRDEPIPSSEVIPPSGNCDWCRVHTDEAMVVQDFVEETLDLVCPQCMAKAATFMKAKAELDGKLQLKRPNPPSSITSDVAALERSWELEHNGHDDH